MSNWRLTFEPLIPWLPLAVAVAVIAAVALWGLWSRQRGAWLRLAALAALAAALLNPVLLDEIRDPLKSVVALVVDRSQSQEIGPRRAQTDEALAAMRERLGRFDQFDVRVVETGQAGAVDERVQTRLFGALDSALQDVPPSRVAGAILLTDGQVHDVPARFAQGQAPVHALVTGLPDERDRRIRLERAPRFGLVDKPVELAYRVLGTSGESGVVDVRVSVNGQPASVRPTRIGDEGKVEVNLPTAGRNIVELVIDPVDGELTAANNRAVAVIDGVRENLRVLLVSGEPHAGERTWRNLLKSDASVDLVHFTILRPLEKHDNTPINELSLIAFPTRELFVDRINDFDLIIFDRYQHTDVLSVLYYDYIAEYVENGGALLIAAGPEYAANNSVANTPLMPALPALPTGQIFEEGFYPRLTDLGKKHPVTRGLEGSDKEPPAWGRWFREIGVADVQGEVVMKGSGERPLLVLNRKGEGRVGIFLSDQGWLWARGFEGGGPHVSLYRRIAHWLMKEPELEEERLTADGRGMTLFVNRQSLSDDPGPAAVISPTGKRLTIPLATTEPGKFAGSAVVDEIGLYQVANGDLTALAHVGPVNAPEFADVVSTEAVLRPAAEATGGSVRRIAASGVASLASNVSLPNIVPVSPGATSAGADWIGLRTTNDSLLRSVSRIPLFAGFAGLAILLLAFGAMWHREGR